MTSLKVKVTQLCPTFCNPMDYTVYGILQDRILEWVAISFTRCFSQPRNRTGVSCIAGRFFTDLSGKPKGHIDCFQILAIMNEAAINIHLQVLYMDISFQIWWGVANTKEHNYWIVHLKYVWLFLFRAKGFPQHQLGIAWVLRNGITKLSKFCFLLLSVLFSSIYTSTKPNGIKITCRNKRLI